MPHIPQDDIATRKREHLELALNEAVRTHDAGFEAITLGGADRPGVRSWAKM